MIDPLVIPIVAIVAFFVSATVCVMTHYVYLMQQFRAENSLKRELMDRGFTAQEIVQIVGAKKGSLFAKTTDVPPAKPIKAPAYG